VSYIEKYYQALPEEQKTRIEQDWYEREMNGEYMPQTVLGTDMHHMQEKKTALIDDILFDLRISPIGQAIDDFLFTTNKKLFELRKRFYNGK
jgi:hypothetical protein